MGMALGARLGVDFMSVDCHLEPALGTPHELDGLYLITVMLDQLCRQTDGSWPIMSFLAVKDLDLHVVCLLMCI